MVRSFGIIAALGLALVPFGGAAAQENAAPPPDVQAKFQQAALKSCNDDLDRNHFDYASIDDCVSYKVARLNRSYRAAGSQTAAGAQGRQPN